MVAFNSDAPVGPLLPGDIFQAYNVASVTKINARDFTIMFADSLDSSPPNTALDYVVLLSLGSATASTISGVYIPPTRNDRIDVQVNSAASRTSLTILTL